MATAAKTRIKPVVKVELAPERAPVAAAQRRPSKEVHTMLDELFVALKPFGACENPKIVTLFHRLKSAT